MVLHIAYSGSMQDARYIWTTKAHGQFLQQVLRSLGGRKLNQNCRARYESARKVRCIFVMKSP